MSGKHPLLDAVNFGTVTLRGAFAASLLALWLAGCGSDGMTKVTADGAGGSTPVMTSDGATLDVATGMSSLDGSTNPGPTDGGPDVSLTFPDASVAVCGNGIVEMGEKCDPAAKDAAGRCPTVCPVQNCTTYKLINKDTCQAQCVPDVAQTTCANGDKCCPSGCNATNDDDCQATCGNNIQEPTETCDPLTNCPKACPQERCNLRKLVGSGTCAAACQTTETITKAINNDNCCPAGATFENDNDCEQHCDNGIKEGDETCDPRESCPKTCPNIACQKYELKNPDTCRAACVATEKIVACVNGDGCCAPGCNANNDSDCPAQCGNGVIEKDETCEPGAAGVLACPTTCPMIECMTRQLVGDKCQAHCETTGIFRTCQAVSDGCCPAGCNSLMSNPNYDADCKPLCGNGVIEMGEICDATGEPSTDCVLRAMTCVTDANKVSTSVGSVAKCDFGCTTTIRGCSGHTNDGFCPSGCAANTTMDNADKLDVDCPAAIGEACGMPVGGGLVKCGGGLSCTDGVCCTQQTCGQCQKCEAGTGMCKPFTGTPPAGSTCDPTTSQCDVGACKLKDGVTGCSGPNSCLSGFCSANNVCCIKACQAGSGSDTECRAMTCQVGTGACDWPIGRGCTTPICQGGPDGKEQSSQSFCALGVLDIDNVPVTIARCIDVRTKICDEGVRCTATAGVGTCPAACASDQDCLGPKYECVVAEGKCKFSPDQACTDGSVCACSPKTTCMGPGKCDLIKQDKSAGKCVADCPPGKTLDTGNNTCVCATPGDVVDDTTTKCCTPESDKSFCERLHGPDACGTVVGTDNCHKARMVGDCAMATMSMCTLPKTCGGTPAGTPNVCGCTPQTDKQFCDAHGAQCGRLKANDNCGIERTVENCGTCTGTGVTCGGDPAGTPNVCGCTPQSTAAYCGSKNCDPLPGTDNCGLPRNDNCGTCADPQICGGGGVANKCGCTPASEATLCIGKCGGPITVVDNCRQDRTITCGGCGANQVCGGVTANVCCTKQSDADFCAAKGVGCGMASGTDNCGVPRTVANCGMCTGGDVCSPSKVCCTPETDTAFCTRLGKNCGSVTANDNCGTSRTVASCGPCMAPSTCTDNICVAPPPGP